MATTPLTPLKLGRRVLLAQARRAALRAAPGALLPLPLLFVHDPQPGEVTLAGICTAMVGFQLLMVVRHVRYLTKHAGASTRWFDPATWPRRRALSALGLAVAVVAMFTWPGGRPLAALREFVVAPDWLVLLLVLLPALAGLAFAHATLVTLPADEMPRGDDKAFAAATSPTKPSVGSTKATGPTPTQGRLGTRIAIACSGGGIRSAAFCLGGLQALFGPDIRTGLYSRAERVYAISGGSYIATAVHVARRCSTGGADEPQVPADLFAPTSPEADWLRRHSSFLLPNSGSVARGAFSLLYGMVSNLTLVLAAQWSLSLYAVWLLGVLPGQDRPGIGAPEATFTVSPMLAWLALGGFAVAAAWVVALKMIGKYTRGRLRTMGPATAAVAGALSVGIALVFIPATLVSAHNAAITNRPTATIAGGLRALGLVDEANCEEALATQFRENAGNAWDRARHQGTSIPFDYGACGNTFTDDAATFNPGTASWHSVMRESTDGSGLIGFRCRTGDAALADDSPNPAACLTADRGSSPWSARITALVAALGALVALVRSVRGTPSGSAPSRPSKVATFVRERVLPWSALGLAALVFTVVGLRLGRWLLTEPGRLADSWSGWLIPVGLLFVANRLFSDATSASLHPFYRERLADAFLIKREGGMAMRADRPEDLARAAGWGPVAAEEIPKKAPGPESTSEAPGPELSILCAANISDVEFVPTKRACVTFRFETGQGNRAYIGTTDRRLPSGATGPDERPLNLSPQRYSAFIDPDHADTTLAGAMAASGAAFSPVVGRAQQLVRPYRILLTLANARLGVWLANPYYALVKAPAEPRQFSTRAKWWDRLWHQPGPFRILKEAIGRQSIYDSRLYVTDGGHFDNTGIVEALRDRPTHLIVLDASADPAGSLDALADAMTTARMDLGLILTPDPDDRARMSAPADGGLPSRAWMRLTAAYESAPDDVVCRIFFVKNALPQNSGLELDAYQRDHPEFPLTTTVNQFYGEYDFEAYRQLGFLNTKAMLEFAWPAGV